MNRFPTTDIGGIEISRLVCGSNPFFGYSHFSHARDTWLKKYFTVDRIAEVLHACVEEGINAVVSGMEERMGQAIEKVREVTGVHVNWICTPGGMTLDECLDGVRWCADHHVEICMPHPSYTDNNLLIAETRIRGAERITELVRELGMVPGFSTHRPETVTVGDRAGYDIETYIQPYNPIGFLCAVETDWACRIINGTPKPIICIKPLAAGRVLPPTGLGFVYNSVKPNDTVACGFMSPEEAQEDIGIARQILAGLEVEVELTDSRSKMALR